MHVERFLSKAFFRNHLSSRRMVAAMPPPVLNSSQGGADEAKSDFFKFALLRHLVFFLKKTIDVVGRIAPVSLQKPLQFVRTGIVHSIDRSRQNRFIGRTLSLHPGESVILHVEIENFSPCTGIVPDIPTEAVPLVQPSPDPFVDLHQADGGSIV